MNWSDPSEVGSILIGRRILRCARSRLLHKLAQSNWAYTSSLSRCSPQPITHEYFRRPPRTAASLFSMISPFFCEISLFTNGNYPRFPGSCARNLDSFTNSSHSTTRGFKAKRAALLTTPSSPKVESLHENYEKKLEVLISSSLRRGVWK